MGAEFRVIFAGEIVEGADPATVRDNFRKLFKADEQRVAVLFSGKRVAIKNNLDEATARKYHKAMTRAGGVCHIEPMRESGAAPAPDPDPAAAARPVPEMPNVVPSRSWKLEAPGADLRDPDARREVPPPPDTGDLSMAEVGADMLDEHAAPAPFEADLDELSVAPPGAELLPDSVPPPPFEADLSELSVAPPGAELVPDARKDKPPPPDPGDLELVN